MLEKNKNQAFVYHSSMYLVMKLFNSFCFSEIGNLKYDCSFVAKLSLKVIFYKVYIICRKNIFLLKKLYI